MRTPDAGPAQTAVATEAATPSVDALDYTRPAMWLCRPDKADSPCTVNLDATAIAPDGSLRVEPFHPAVSPTVDCFYVYPTVSLDPGLNSDLNANQEELNVVTQQFARLGSVCRLFAPLYRQVTITALNSGRFETPAANLMAYSDVLAAWRDYLARDNQGRGIILIGHSQGSRRLTQLIKEQIDPDPSLRSRLVSAFLLGGGVKVPPGSDVGGDFQHVPACRDVRQTGCVVTFASFSADSTPSALSYFGRGGVLCVNPGAPAGGVAKLHPYFLSTSFVRARIAAAEVTTPFVTFVDQVDGECRSDGGASYLAVTASGRATLPPFLLGPEWGLHLIDVNLVMGDLVALTASQANAYRGR